MELNSKAIKGSTTECLKHYLESLPGKKGSKNVRQEKMPLAKFVGVSINTVARWAAGRNKPQGNQIISVWFFLEALGYTVEELDSIRKSRPEALYISELLGFRVFSAKQIREKLFYSHTNEIYRIARGDISSDRHEMIRTLYIGCQKEIEQRKARLSTQSIKPENRETVATVESQKRKLTPSQELEMFAYLVLAMIPLAERLASDKFSPEDRRHLRKLADDKGIFRLSTAINKLCGEKVREQIIETEKEGNR